jgi:hypothetical protein
MSEHRYPHCRVNTHPEWYPTEKFVTGFGWIAQASGDATARDERLKEEHGAMWRWHDPARYIAAILIGISLIIYSR